MAVCTAAAILLLTASSCADKVLSPELAALSLPVISVTPQQLVLSDGTSTMVLRNSGSKIEFCGVPVILPDEVQCGKDKLWTLPERSAKFILNPLLHPRKLKVRRIMLDPGHGGSDNGATGISGIREKTLNLSLALAVKAELEKAGFTVIMSRESDRKVPLGERGILARKNACDIFLSLHHNFSPSNPNASGIESFVLLPETPAEMGKSSRSIHLAYLIQKEQSGVTGNFGRGVKFARFRVLRDAHCPAVLIEAGFLSSRADESRCRDPEYQAKLAAAITRAIRRCAAL